MDLDTKDDKKMVTSRSCYGSSELTFVSRCPFSSVVQPLLIPIPGWLVSVRLHPFNLPIINARVTAATHQVYVSDGEVWDATLNQTDLSKNANKYVTLIPSWKPRRPLKALCRRFYVLQLLHPVGNNSACVLLTRWGRVGETGSSQRKVRQLFAAARTTSYADSLQGSFAATIAISEFRKQFKSKTATNWEDRRAMVSAKSGKS